MIIDIKGPTDLKKIVIFARHTSDVVFRLIDKDFEWLLQELIKVQQDYNVTIQFVCPDEETTRNMTILFGIIGAAVGYTLGGLPYFILGSAAGGISGYALSHIKIEFERNANTFTIIK